ncbi:uncharacterized protein LOC119154788 [Falco rusticolus]|uniref:uncharacterized protein LOC119154788 n=1 Tax=Falco rusticolus TaxID=120794 RepID=UPI0018868686|nr:uncharacterized protein LOC119154788 [Falco rusticolus]
MYSVEDVFKNLLQTPSLRSPLGNSVVVDSCVGLSTQVSVLHRGAGDKGCHLPLTHLFLHLAVHLETATCLCQIRTQRYGRLLFSSNLQQLRDQQQQFTEQLQNLFLPPQLVLQKPGIGKIKGERTAAPFAEPSQPQMKQGPFFLLSTLLKAQPRAGRTRARLPSVSMAAGILLHCSTKVHLSFHPGNNMYCCSIVAKTGGESSWVRMWLPTAAQANREER